MCLCLWRCGDVCAHAGDSHTCRCRENPPVTTYHLQYRETHVNMLILNISYVIIKTTKCHFLKSKLTLTSWMICMTQQAIIFAK